jgi:hypothetical protein
VELEVGPPEPVDEVDGVGRGIDTISQASTAGASMKWFWPTAKALLPWALYVSWNSVRGCGDAFAVRKANSESAYVALAVLTL